MLPFTPLVYVVYEDIGVELKALTFTNVGTDAPKYSDISSRHFANVCVPMLVAFGKLNVVRFIQP